MFDVSTSFRKKGNLILGGETNNNLSSSGRGQLGLELLSQLITLDHRWQT